MPLRDQHLYDLPRQAFVEFDPDAHLPTRWSGTKSALLTASAANFSAALRSSGVNWGQADNTSWTLSPSAMLATIWPTGTRVPLMQGSP